MVEKLKIVGILSGILLLVVPASSLSLPIVSKNHYQGDIILTKTQKLILSQKNTLVSTGLIDTTYRWPKNNEGKVVIPFHFDPSSKHTFAERTIIYNALRELERKVRCLEFVPRTTENDYIDVVNRTGCNSALGRSGGRQTVDLFHTEQSTVCIDHPTVMHEFIHALGFDHMHNRFDRDNYIQIFEGNVDPIFLFAFNKGSTSRFETYNTRYDFDSVMHYDRKAFLKPGLATNLDTMLPLPENSQYNDIIGVKRLSAGDIARIRIMYGC